MNAVWIASSTPCSTWRLPLRHKLSLPATLLHYARDDMPQVRRVAAGQLRPRRTGLVCSATAEVLRSADAPAGSAAPAIKLFYRTGWDKAVAHGSLAGAAWTDFPLVKVQGACRGQAAKVQGACRGQAVKVQGACRDRRR